MTNPTPPQQLSKPDQWQEYCTQVLQKCVTEPIATRAQAWSKERSHLIHLARKLIENVKHQRILIADASLVDADLTNFDFRYCYIVRCSFRKAKLKGAKFDYAILRQSDLHEADVCEASFFKADLKEVILSDVKYDEDTKWILANWDRHGEVAGQLLDRIDRDCAHWANRNAPLIVRALNYATDHGFGIHRVAIACAATPVAFGILYWLLDRRHFAVAAGNGSPETLTIWNFILLSLERFVSGSPWIFGVSLLAHFLTALETLLGFLLLGLLIAMLVRQILRK